MAEEAESSPERRDYSHSCSSSSISIQYLPSARRYRAIFTECTYGPRCTRLTESIYLLSRRRGNYDEVNRAHRGPYHEVNMLDIGKREVDIVLIFSSSRSRISQCANLENRHRRERAFRREIAFLLDRDIGQSKSS